MEWNYSLVQERAAQIDQEMKMLIERDDWGRLKELIEFPYGTWEGKAVLAFYDSCDKLIAAQDWQKARVIPEVMRMIVREKMKSDAKVAGQISRNFSPFY